MLVQQIQNVLFLLATETFPEHTIASFQVQVYAKEMATRHADYRSGSQVIRIFNLSRKSEHILITSIHELAHHCEWCIYGSTGHSKQFYKVYYALLTTAVELGIIEYAQAQAQSDVRDIRSLERYFGPVVAQPKAISPILLPQMIKVHQAYSFRDQLKTRNYRYEMLEETWAKPVSDEELEEELVFLSTLTSKENIQVIPSNQFDVQAIYFVVVNNGYEYRVSLKENGYRFRGYQHTKGNLWVKKIHANQMEKEKQWLSQFKGIQVKFEGKK